MPTPLRLDEQTLRLFYCSRDAGNRAHVFWADLLARPPWTIRAVSDGPVLAPGGPGTFDAAGVMPTALVQRDGALWMYYIGWSVRADVPYHNAIGIACSTDGGQSFKRLLPGPVIGTGPHEPLFCGTGDIARIDDQWVMWYMSATEWRFIKGQPEPRYHLKQAFSDDGINWDFGQSIAIDYLDDAEGGIARATVLPDETGYWMWFCYRGVADYRGTGPNGYRIGLAWSQNGTAWQRLPQAQIFETGPGPGAFDAFMQCYPAVFKDTDQTWLFYNGSDFGQTGIGVAALRPSNMQHT